MAMVDSSGAGMHDINLASRKAEEAAWRRYQAANWLDSLVGPLGLPSSRPSEREFISCLRNGQFLCNAINKIHPGAVPKVVENISAQQSFGREAQPLPAYQYFENVRNFLVAAEELKLPAFEASDLERDALEAGSAAKVVDCILGLKTYYEWKQTNNCVGLYKHMRSPSVMHSACKIQAQPSATTPSNSQRKLFDTNYASEKQPASVDIEGLIVKLLADSMVEAKENIDRNVFASISNGKLDPLMISSLKEQLQSMCPELSSIFGNFLKGRGRLHSVTSSVLEDLSNPSSKCCRSCSKDGDYNCQNIFQMQKKELQDLKALLVKTKREFEDLQSQFRRDIKELVNLVQEMSTAALGYHKVVKENRTLFNMVQDLKGNIRVYCRIRPIFNAEAKNVVDFVGEDGSLVIFDPSKPQRDGRKVFQFNRVFGPLATQDDIYMDTQPLIRSVMDGYNVCIFAYGQTGSGKTHTMSGPSGGSMTDMGINYLALKDLFELSNGRKDIISYDISVQMVEIYNEQVRDLLAEDSATTKLEIRTCTSDSGLSLPGATMHPVKSTTDVVNLMKLGDVNRVVSSTALNSRSSRSHSVLTVHVHGKDVSGAILRSCLHLVDLAGSERVDKSEVTGERLKEAQCINRSLSCLGDVITALAHKNSHIPYRNSKLTLLLQDALGGHAKTLMFAHVNPVADSLGETLSTLKFAQRVSTVELGVAHANKESSEVLRLKEQIESLKRALASKEMEAKSSHRPKEVTEQTPPRLRRLSIENQTPITKTEKLVNRGETKSRRTPASIRSRRLSIEGPRTCKKENLETEMLDNFIKLPSLEAASNQKIVQFLEAEISGGHVRQGSSTIGKNHLKAPRSPTNFFDTPMPNLQLPKTPELQLASRNEVCRVVQGELALSAEPHMPNVSMRGMQMESHVKKSLRTTIGKLIGGSEKRKQRPRTEARSSIRGSTTFSSGGSAVVADARTVRRRSLTGPHISGSDCSRRSSIGGNSTSTDVNDQRNAKTPPPINPSLKVAQRWI